MQKELLICENDPVQAENLAALADSFGLGFTIHTYNQPENLMRDLSMRTKPAVILMDIMLDDEKNGIEIVKRIHSSFLDYPVIFISGSLEKACDVYEVPHCYFVYKPQKEEKLPLALNKAAEILEQKPSVIMLHEGKDLIPVPPKEILCIERIRRATMITMADRVYQVQETFSDLSEMLPDSFEQCHRNYMVNFENIRRFSPASIELINGLQVPVSRRMSSKFHERFQQWLRSSGENVL